MDYTRLDRPYFSIPITATRAGDKFRLSLPAAPRLPLRFAPRQIAAEGASYCHRRY